jgi:hypothetical protein
MAGQCPESFFRLMAQKTFVWLQWTFRTEASSLSPVLELVPFFSLALDVGRALPPGNAYS